MEIISGLKHGDELKKYFIGAHPIIQYYINQLQIPQTIRRYIKQDKRNKVGVECVLCTMLHNLLAVNSPLYEIEEWLSPLDTKKLGITQEECELIYDERVGRALEALYSCRKNDIFFTLSLNAIKLFELNCTQIHNDTTTVTFAGKYDDWRAQEASINYGHNKDHRPDLKQLVLGVSITADGAVPIDYKISSGNQSDDKTHIPTHKRLQKLLGNSDFIYVADSKLASEENLEKISSWSGKFVTIMPRTWKEHDAFSTRVMNEELEWMHILSRPNNRKPKKETDYYYAVKGKFSTSQGYNLYWIRSSQKMKQDEETRTRRLKKTIAQLNLLKTKLNKYKLKTYSQIKDRVEKILNSNRCEAMISFQIELQTKSKKRYLGAGRPTSGTSITVIEEKQYSLIFVKNIEQIEKIRKLDGIFPIITNLNPSQYNAKSILEIYKNQPFIEKRFSQIKTYQEIMPVFLKKDERVLGLLHLQVMALLIASLIERNLRLAMKSKGIKALRIYPEQRKCKTPTMFDVIRLFKRVERYEVRCNDDTIIFPAKLTDVQIQVLNLLNIPIALYQ